MEDKPAPISVIVLAYNESECVGAVLGELTRWLDANIPGAEIVFVDDGSSDGTTDLARQALVGRRARFVRHGTNRGMGAGLKTAQPLCRGEWVTFLPADGQIEPEAVGTLYDEARRHRADVVLSVYDHRDDGLRRKVLSAGVRALIAGVHGVRLHSDGPYLFRRRVFDPGQLPADTFFLNFEFPIRAIRSGLSVRTVTIACRPRRAGQSKSTGWKRVAGVAHDLLAMRVRSLLAAVSRNVGRKLD